MHGEADLLPSLVIDRYGPYLVLQALSQGMDRLLPSVTGWLSELLSPAGILARNDPKVRALEGLEQTVEVLAGTVPDTVVVREGPIEYEVDLRKVRRRDCSSTSARTARRRHATRTAGCSTASAITAGSRCGWPANAPRPRRSTSRPTPSRASRRTRRATAWQSHARGSQRLRRAAAARKAGERYDTIVLDPPAFAKNKASVPNALAGYKEINLRAMRLLSPGGYLVTCSCSYNVNEEMFAEVLHEASVDSHTPVTIVEKRMQGRDHPVLVGAPETHYLKCFILRRVE